MKERVSRLGRTATVAAAAIGAVLSGIATVAPAQAAANGYDVYVWATDVNVRSCPEVSNRCAPLPGVKVSRQRVPA